MRWRGLTENIHNSTTSKCCWRRRNVKNFEKQFYYLNSVSLSLSHMWEHLFGVLRTKTTSLVSWGPNHLHQFLSVKPEPFFFFFLIHLTGLKLFFLPLRSKEMNSSLHTTCEGVISGAVTCNELYLLWLAISSCYLHPHRPRQPAERLLGCAQLREEYKYTELKHLLLQWFQQQ